MNRQRFGNDGKMMRNSGDKTGMGREIHIHFPMQPVAVLMFPVQDRPSNIRHTAGFIGRIFVARKMVHIIPWRNI